MRTYFDSDSRRAERWGKTTHRRASHYYESGKYCESGKRRFHSCHSNDKFCQADLMELAPHDAGIVPTVLSSPDHIADLLQALEQL